MNTVSVTLPANKTYGHRIALWQRLTLPGDYCCGILEIREAKEEGRKLRVRRYAVMEHAPHELNLRTFKLTKPLTTTDEDKVHFVCLHPHNVKDACQCKGFMKNGDCAHLEALRTLQAQAQLTAPKPVSNGKPAVA